MVPELQYRNSSTEHLRTWERLTKLFLVGTVCIAVLLLIMAGALVPPRGM